MFGRMRLFVSGASLFALGLFLCFVQSPEVREQAARVPRMTCADLIKFGRAVPPLVTLTDVHLCSGGFVSERDSETGDLDQLIVPVYGALAGAEPNPRELTLLLRICDNAEKDRVFGQSKGLELTCEVHGDLALVERELLDELAKKYSGIHPERCRLLTIGLDEPTEEHARSVMLGGLSCLAIGAVLGGLSLLRPARLF
jgi:hypothetical protein